MHLKKQNSQLAGNKNEYMSARDISNIEKIPYQFLRRILQELIKNKYVLSKEGVNGGVKLNKDCSMIKISDVIKIFQENLELVNCIFRKKICENSAKCVLRKEIIRIEDLVSNELEKLTVGDLIKKTGGIE